MAKRSIVEFEMKNGIYHVTIRAKNTENFKAALCALKGKVPSAFRLWDSGAKVWQVCREYAEELRVLADTFTEDVDGEDGNAFVSSRKLQFAGGVWKAFDVHCGGEVVSVYWRGGYGYLVGVEALKCDQDLRLRVVDLCNTAIGQMRILERFYAVGRFNTSEFVAKEIEFLVSCEIVPEGIREEAKEFLSGTGIYASQGKEIMHSDCVYLLKADNGAYKIGVSNNVDRRKIEITTALHLDLETVNIVCYSRPIPDAYRIEGSLHERYGYLRVAGEWFNLTGQDVVSIQDYLKRL